MARQEQPAYPFTADYSSNFEMGDPKNVQFRCWSCTSTGTTTRSTMPRVYSQPVILCTSLMVLYLAGSRDSLIVMAKQVRGQMGTVADSVHKLLSAPEQK